MAQQGYLFLKHGAWYVRYRNLDRHQQCERLASKADYPKKSEVEPLRREFMAKINRAMSVPTAGATVGEFVEGVYMPSIDRRLKSSTVDGYKKAWHKHLKHRIGLRRVRDCRPCDIQAVMDTIDHERGASLSHNTYKWLKVTISAIFAHAVRSGVIDSNPVKSTIIPKGKKHGRKTYAYSLREIQNHLSVFAGSDPINVIEEDGEEYIATISRAMVRSLIGVAGYAGLRQGEIRGLMIDDDHDNVLIIQRSIWETTVNDETKTGEDNTEPGLVPIIQPLRQLLDAVKPEHGFFFVGQRGAVIDLNNLACRVMKPFLNASGLKWHGWHAYRRGLASNLHELGVDDITIQSILRHSDVSTTRRHYIKTVPQAAVDAMQKLACATNVQQQPLPNKQNIQ